MTETQEKFYGLIKSFAGQKNMLSCPRPFVDAFGGIEAGIIVNHLVYLDDEHGNDWFWHKFDQWQFELGISKDKLGRHFERLESAEIIQTKVQKMNGNPTKHFKLNQEKVAEILIETIQNRKPQNTVFRKPQKPINENSETRESSYRNIKELNIKDNNNKSHVPAIAVTNEALELTQLLIDRIKENNPNNLQLRNGHLEDTGRRWSLDIDKMIRLDNRAPDEIKSVIEWSQADDFWKSNILSASTLRKQYDRLIPKMKAMPKNKKLTAYEQTMENGRMLAQFYKDKEAKNANK